LFNKCQTLIGPIAKQIYNLNSINIFIKATVFNLLQSHKYNIKENTKE